MQCKIFKDKIVIQFLYKAEIATIELIEKIIIFAGNISIEFKPGLTIDIEE